MEHCVETLLAGGEDVEILIVDDGSKDQTAHIADRLQEEHPGIIRAIHQENKGHGGAVNTGIANATGTFIKIVDSDDWVNENAYREIMQFLRSCVEEEHELDMLVSNFVYEKVGAKHKKVMRYHKALPRNTFFQWKDVRSFNVGQYILMHSVIYRTEVLRESGLKLPEHTFYVDNLYVYYPLPYVKTMYYLDVNFYRYFIGREDQSVNEQVMISRLDQQIYVNKLMVESYDVDQIQDKRLREYMYQYLEIITVISSVLLLRSGTKENLEKKKELWAYIKKHNRNMYTELRYKKFLGYGINLHGKIGHKTVLLVYKVCQKIFGFN
jgi:glycosyltransferase involved in cell wall biosynthesis